MDIQSIIVFILILWIIKILSDIVANQKILAFANDKIHEELTEIREKISNIKDSTDSIEMSSSETAYNTDKIRYMHGHRTESEEFEEEHDIPVGNNKDFS